MGSGFTPARRRRSTLPPWLSAWRWPRHGGRRGVALLLSRSPGCHPSSPWAGANTGWAMTPTALGLGLEPLDEAEAARGVVTDYLVEGHLPEGVVYVGPGHHSHRLKRSKWACPYVPGHHCAADEWAPRYIEHIAMHLWDSLGELQGHTLVCDCPVEVYCVSLQACASTRSPPIRGPMRQKRPG